MAFHISSLLETFPRLQDGLKPAVIALATLLGLTALRRVFSLVKVVRSPSYFPKLWTPLQPFTVPGVLFKTASTSSWNHGRDWHWVRRYQSTDRLPAHESKNIDGPISILDVKLRMGSQRSSFFKPEETMEPFTYWGMNLISSNGAMWRKHRRVVGPAFGPELYKLVWRKTLEIYRDMIEVEGWKDKDVVDIPVIQKVTFKIAFLIVRLLPPQAADGGMPVQEALRVVADTIVLFTAVPKWLYYLPIPKLREIQLARERLRVFMQEQVVQRRALVAAGDTRADVFTIMVKSNQDESSKYQLDDDELIGNIFAFLFAGHETTANTFAVTLGYMAINEEIQNEVVEQIMSVVGPDRDPEYDDYPKLDKVLAIFYEATRMVPAGHVLIRQAMEDTVLNVPNPVGEEGSKMVPIPKGTEVILDMVGVQYNPRYFEDPETYKPSRWYGLPPDSERFTAFSVGGRACLGRKFATVEATCFLTLILREWQVLPVFRSGETKEAWSARVMNDTRALMTLSVAEFPLRLVRRKRV
ncbi:hypothetical protein MVEN_00766700 [Mycena venus]|uniref:Cytochrome P450 n=1 Tax=Mycena venus TaxID=2733690 RepID=A0A8H7D3R8_9AGAR|nr:hypothetical protein MVEN_00766700 [Mycena venus]